MTRFAPLQIRKDVWLNDLPFSNVDEAGNRWLITDIDGWWDLPTPTMGEVDRAYSEDGSYYEPGRFESRVLRMKGKIIPKENSSNAINIARQELNKRLMLVRKTGLLQVLEAEELGGGKQSEVVIVARPLVSTKNLNGTLDFDIQFRAPDPRKYSVDLETAVAYLVQGEESGRMYDLVYNRSYEGEQDLTNATIINRGDYNTYGIVRFHGPVDNPSVTHLDTERVISFTNLRLGIGQYLDVNLLEKTVLTESGISLRDRMDNNSRWFNLDVGTNRLSFGGSQYIEPVPSVPDVKNYVEDPSFEGDTDGYTLRTIRSNITKNPSGMTYTTEKILRERVFNDPQATNSASFSTGTVVAGSVQSPTITLANGGISTFPDGDLNYFTQVEVRPNTSAVTTGTLTMGSSSSGAVALTQGVWTKIRVDGYKPTSDITISLNLPNASSTNTVSIRNIMVLRSTDPIAGEIAFWNPVVGATADGVETIEVGGIFKEVVLEPEHWSLPNNPTSTLRVIGDDVYILPGEVGDHEVDFGAANQAGTEITYGVLGDEIKKINLYNNATGELLESNNPSTNAFTYISPTAITPKVTAVFDVRTTGAVGKRKIEAVMVTYGGGKKIFTDRTPEYDGYTYDNYSTFTTAREMAKSFVTSDFTGEFNYDAREVSTRSSSGSRSLEIKYRSVTDDPPAKPTPVSRPTVSLATGSYFVRARVMANMPVNVRAEMSGLAVPTYLDFSTSANNWYSVEFPIEVNDGETPYLTLTPMGEYTGLEIYVDDVGILDSDIAYFDGDTVGPYQWTGAHNGSISATIPVVGIPTAKMEVMFRSAWIG